MNEIIHKNIFLWSGFCRTFPSSWAINLFLKTTKPKHWPFDKNTLWQYHLPLTFHYWVDYTLHIQTEKKKRQKGKKELLFAFLVLLFLVIFCSFLFYYWQCPQICHETALTLQECCFVGVFFFQHKWCQLLSKAAHSSR